jgi:hypothetical protein
MKIKAIRWDREENHRKVKRHRQEGDIDGAI